MWWTVVHFVYNTKPLFIAILDRNKTHIVLHCLLCKNTLLKQSENRIKSRECSTMNWIESWLECMVTPLLHPTHCGQVLFLRQKENTLIHSMQLPAYCLSPSHSGFLHFFLFTVRREVERKSIFSVQVKKAGSSVPGPPCYPWCNRTGQSQRLALTHTDKVKEYMYHHVKNVCAHTTWITALCVI